jgi:hypothetical protein
MINLSLQLAEETHRVLRRRGSHILQTIGSQMAVRLRVLRRKILVLVSC